MCSYLGLAAFRKDRKLKLKNRGQAQSHQCFMQTADSDFFFFNKLKPNSRCLKLGSKKRFSCKNTEVRQKILLKHDLYGPKRSTAPLSPLAAGCLSPACASSGGSTGAAHLNEGQAAARTAGDSLFQPTERNDHGQLGTTLSGTCAAIHILPLQTASISSACAVT